VYSYFYIYDCPERSTHKEARYLSSPSHYERGIEPSLRLEHLLRYAKALRWSDPPFKESRDPSFRRITRQVCSLDSVFLLLKPPHDKGFLCEAYSHPASQDSPCFCVAHMFLAVFTRARCWTLPSTYNSILI
jgi:hypothetical protein